MNKLYSSLLLRWTHRPLVALGLLLAMAGAAQAQMATSFAYTGGTQTYVVPAGITQLQIAATGASGGTRGGQIGYGGYVQATILVTPGEVLTVLVGGQGRYVANTFITGGYNGGGASFNAGAGGGATDVRRAGTSTGDYLSSRNALVVAGGGGGVDAAPGSGGSGGTPNGGSGTSYNKASASRSGGGATQASPGSAGRGNNDGTLGSTAMGQPGSNNVGGDGGGGYFSCGGGGGYYGGGGSAPGAGAGGGSSWVMPTGSSNVSYSLASTTGNGLLSITPLVLPTLSILSPTSGPMGTSVTLTGTNLSGPTAVSFNGTVAPFTAVNATTLTAIVPSGASSGNVTVTTPGGVSNGVAFAVTLPRPTNDDCANATLLTVTATCAPTAGTTLTATQSLPAITCGGFTGTADADVWYKFVASAATQTVTVMGNAGFDAVVDVRSGVCPGNNIGCADRTVAGGTEIVSLTGLSTGSTYYVRVYSYAVAGTFTICVTQPSTAAPVLTQPAASSTNGLPTYTGTAPAGSTVTLYLAAGSGAAQVISTTTATGGTFSLTPTTALTSGSYSVYATAQSSGATVSANSNTNTFTVDATPPTIVSFTRQNPTATLTNAAAVTYRLTFNEAVTGVDSRYFNFFAQGAPAARNFTLTAVSASMYDVTVVTAGVSGSLVTQFSRPPGLTDLAGNAATFMSFASEGYIIDLTAPAVTGLTTTAGNSTSMSPIPFTVIFSEAVTGFAAGGISVTNGTISSGPSGNGSVYAFQVMPTGNGAVTVSVAAGAAQDAAGNSSSASGSVSVVYTAPVASGLSVQYQTGDLGQPTDGQVRPFLQLVNSGTSAVPYSSLTVRYWLTVENFQGQLVTPIDYAKLGTGFVSARYVALATPRQGALGYIEYSFAAAAGNLAPGSDSGPIFGKAYKPDYSNLDETDDWSYQTSSSFTTNDHVTLYQNGTLLAGTEPPAVTATTALNVFSASRDASPSTQFVSVQLQVRNTGNAPVNYSDVKLRYYFTRDGATTIVPQVDYAKLGNGNLTLRVVNLATAVSGADAYLEVGFAAALGVFYPRTSTDDILLKLRKDNYQALDQTNDYSFTGSTALLVNNRLPAYLNGSLVFGTPPNGAPARVAAPSQPASASGATIVAATSSGPQALTASPNPFGEQLTLRFALPTTQAYALAVYDGQGRLVQQVASGEAPAEQAQELTMSTQGYAAGLYLVRLTTASGVQTLKLIKQ